MAAALALAAAPIAVFYREPDLHAVVVLLAINYLLIPFGSITMAYLQRQMRFGPSLVVQTSANLLQSGVAIYGAMLGYSYLALAWGSVAGALTMVVGAAFFRPRELPLLPGIAGIKPVLSFGSKMMVNSSLQQLSQTAPSSLSAGSSAWK